MTTEPPLPSCPFGFGGSDDSASLTRRDPPHTGPAVTCDERGVYRVHSFEAAQGVLRSDAVRQAGFMAESVSDVPTLTRQPVLFAEGEEHHTMRRQTARYFTPAAVAGYHPMIAALSDRLVGELAARGEANLDDLSLKLAVAVAAQVVGLTSSAAPGLERRVMRFVEGGADSEPGVTPPGGRVRELLSQVQVAAFYLLDVRPAILARRRERRGDLISHLLDRGYNDTEILTECLTYGTAGMVTTREFISVAAWHLLRDPELRAEYVHGTERERYAVLHEILRLEPVVGTLYRRAATDLEVGGVSVPAGSLLALHVTDTNVDRAVAGEDAGELCPGRALPRGVPPQMLAFGDGHHRCPGAFLAIAESDVLLRRLLIWRDLRVVTPPTVTYNETVKGYELRGFRVRLGGPTRN